MSLLRNPILVIVLGVISGVAGGLLPFWKAADRLVAAALANATKEHAGPAPEKEKGWDFWTIEVDNLASELKDEKARLKKQTEQLDQREAHLVAEQKELQKVRAELESMQKQIDIRVVEIHDDEARNLKSLSKVYSDLAPKAVVAIMGSMDDTNAVKILSLMKSDATTAIFDEMSRNPVTARRAAALSDKIRLMKTASTTTPTPAK